MSESELIHYVRLALEAIENGETLDLETLCAEHPEHIEAVAEAIGLRGGLAAVHRAAESIDPLVGREIGGRYRLEIALGRGAMGVVYAAFDTQLERTVAVKLFHEGHGRTEEDQERFVREALILATVEHEHVVSVFDRGRSETGELWVVMEHLVGRPLSAVLMAAAETFLPGEPPEFGEWSEPVFDASARPQSTYIRTLVRWLADVAAGLHAAHERGVSHRDVKPSNIFIRENLEAVLIDFGIATRSGDAALTATNTGIGTPWYMAPEQVSGAGRESATTDVYGLCATLYHMLALRPPYEGSAATVFADIRTLDPRPIRAIRPDLPRDLVAILEHGMERDPRARYGTMAELESDLRAFLDHRPVRVRPLSTVGRWARRARRRPARAIAIATSTVLLPSVIALSILISNRREAERQQRKLEAITTLPYALAVEGAPTERPQLAPEQRSRDLETLSRILDLDSSDAAHRVYRAALHLDAGDHEASAEDMATIARDQPSAHTTAIAARYDAADLAKPGHSALNLVDIPPPANPFDRFLSAFHELRGRARGYADRALELLEQDPDYRPSGELSIIALLARAELGRDSDACGRAFETARAAAESRGRETAATLAAQGSAMAFQRNYAQAIPLLERSLELCPDQFSALTNLGTAYRKTGALDRAATALRRTREIRSSSWRPFFNLAGLLKDRGEFDQARQEANSMPGADWRRENLLGTLRRHEAVKAHLVEEQRRLAELAVGHFNRALELAPERRSVRLRIQLRLELARAVREGDWTAAVGKALDFIALTGANAEDPISIANLADMISRADLGSTTHSIEAYLHRLASALGAGDVDFAAQQRELIRTALSRKR